MNYLYGSYSIIKRRKTKTCIHMMEFNFSFNVRVLFIILTIIWTRNWPCSDLPRVFRFASLSSDLPQLTVSLNKNIIYIHIKFYYSNLYLKRVNGISFDQYIFRLNNYFDQTELTQLNLTTMTGAWFILAGNEIKIEDPLK